MTNNSFSDPTQFQLQSITIDGNDMTGFFFSLSIYENIYIPAVTGTIVLLDTDTGGFIEKYKIEFIEEIEFTVKNALDQTLQFKGFLNGLKNEMTKDSKKMYAIDFTSKFTRKNERTFVTKRFNKVAPEEVVKEMLEDKIEADEVEIKAQGIPMNFLGSRRKPFDIIKYVLTHGVDTNGPEYTEGGDRKGTAKGMNGFLCWETTKAFRFASVEQLRKGEAGEKHEGYKKQVANMNHDMETAMKGVVDYSFQRIGNMQDKLRSGALNSKGVYFDMDKGEYMEIDFFDDENMTDKEKEIATSFTRVLWKPISNERHNNECEKAQPDTGDQTKKQLQQNVARQNTFDDQLGEFTLPPNFKMHAGDVIDFKIGKVKSEEEGEYDKKHSGQYVIKSLAHHFMFGAQAYTKIATIRTNKQQDDSTSKQ